MSKEINETLKQCNTTYGKFSRLSEISRDIKSTFHNTENWNELSSDKQEALEMIAIKIARILNGNSEYVDSWFDIAGYATLIVNELNSGKDKDLAKEFGGLAGIAEGSSINLNTKDYIKCGVIGNLGYHCTLPTGHTGYHEARVREGSTYPDDKWLEGTPVNFSSKDYIKCLVDGGTGRPCQRPINHSGMHEEGANRWD